MIASHTSSSFSKAKNGQHTANSSKHMQQKHCTQPTLQHDVNSCTAGPVSLDVLRRPCGKVVVRLASPQFKVALHVFREGKTHKCCKRTTMRECRDKKAVWPCRQHKARAAATTHADVRRLAPPPASSPERPFGQRAAAYAYDTSNSIQINLSALKTHQCACRRT